MAGLEQELAADHDGEQDGKQATENEPRTTRASGGWTHAGAGDARDLRHVGFEALIDGRLGLVRHGVSLTRELPLHCKRDLRKRATMVRSLGGGT